MCNEFISRPSLPSGEFAWQILGTWCASFLTELWCCDLMPWNQHNKMVLEEQCLLWSFFNLCAPAFSRSTNCFTRVTGLKPTDCFCRLVAVVILSLPWNSISRETETLAAVSTFLVLYLVEVFTELGASLRMVSLCQCKQICGNRVSHSGHDVFQNKQLPYPSPESQGDFEVSPSLAEARVEGAMEMLVVIMTWVRALGEWLMAFIDFPGEEEWEGGEGEALMGFVCAQRGEVDLGRQCGLSLRKLAL